jgi:hypothetical protein
MKTYLILFIFLLTAGNTFSQNNNLTTKLLEQADDMGKKFIAKDYSGFLKYSHPKVVKTMGGEAKMIADTKKEIESLENEGVTFLSIKFGAPDKIITIENELQCTFPEMIEMQVTGGKLTTTTTLIAISTDNGNNWYFLDTGGNNLYSMKMLLPNLSDELDIPIPSDPIFEEDIKPE